MRAKLLVAAVVLSITVVACGRSKPVGVVEPGPGDAGGETAAPTGLRACLDRPDDLPRPPTAGLPCDLIPPDLAL